MDPVSVLSTPAFAHHGVAWSPFYENKLAIAASANYGLLGNGRLSVATLAPPNNAVIDKTFETQDALFDLAWSEIHENQVVTAGGDGTIRLWDITLNISNTPSAPGESTPKKSTASTGQISTSLYSVQPLGMVQSASGRPRDRIRSKRYPPIRINVSTKHSSRHTNPTSSCRVLRTGSSTSLTCAHPRHSHTQHQHSHSMPIRRRSSHLTGINGSPMSLPRDRSTDLCVYGIVGW